MDTFWITHGSFSSSTPFFAFLLHTYTRRTTFHLQEVGEWSRWIGWKDEFVATADSGIREEEQVLAFRTPVHLFHGARVVRSGRVHRDKSEYCVAS